MISLPSCAMSHDPSRICPGMYFAHNSIFIAIAQMLYVFNFSKARNDAGREITPGVEYDGFIRCVFPMESMHRIASSCGAIVTHVPSHARSSLVLRQQRGWSCIRYRYSEVVRVVSY